MKNLSIIQIFIESELAEELLERDVEGLFEKVKSGKYDTYSYNLPITSVDWRVQDRDLIYLNNFFAVNLEGNLKPVPKVYRTGELEIDLRCSVVRKNGKEIKVVPSCFRVLESLVKAKGTIVSRAVLTRLIEGENRKPLMDNTLNQHIKRLRKIIGTYQGKEYFSSVYKLGYRWDFDIEESED